MNGVRCLLGSMDPDGRHVTAVPIDQGADPDTMITTLRQLLHGRFDGDTDLMRQRLLAHGWVRLDANPQPGPAWSLLQIVDGVGLTVSDPPRPVRRPVSTPNGDPDVEWLYVLDERLASVTVFEATVHGRFARHSLHWLFHPAHPIPSVIGVVGDDADAHTAHQWRPAIVSLDGMHTAWQVEICPTELARGVVLARFEYTELRDMVDAFNAFYDDRRPGTGIPRLVFVEGVLLVVWYSDTCHEQIQQITPRGGSQYTIGSNILPWILTQEDPPGQDPHTLRNAASPLLQWVTQDGLHALHPQLCRFSLAEIAQALINLGDDDRPAVLDSTNGVTVWSVTAGYALRLAPTRRLPYTEEVILPRPLSGSWHHDVPVPAVSTYLVAATCAWLRTTPTTGPHPQGGGHV